MRTTAVLGVALAATLLAGCSDGDPGDGGEVAQEPTTRTSDEPTDEPTDEGGDDGGDDFLEQDPADIALAAKDAMAGLQSVRMAGSLTNDGEEVSLDLALSTTGDCSGSVTVAGGTISVLGTGGQVWFQGDDAFWQASAGEQASTILDLIDGRWVVVAADDDSFGQFCDLGGLLEEMVSDDGEDTYELGDVTDVDGVEAVAVVNTSDEGGPSTGYVQVDGDHYLLQMVREDGDEPGDISFSQFDEPVEVTAPAAEDTVDLDELGG